MSEDPATMMAIGSVVGAMTSVASLMMQPKMPSMAIPEIPESPPRPPVTRDNAESIVNDPQASAAEKSQAQTLLDEMSGERRRIKQKAARAGLIQTGPQGLLDEPETYKKTILGGTA